MKIFLLGMMGSGKSYWAKKLAKKLKCGAYDLDYLVEMNEEKTISELFAEDGEAYFRKTEAKILRWFAEKKAFVLATGGGTPCFNDNVEWMNQHGITIWLNEPVETLVERLKPEKSHRPLISQLSDDELHNFLNKKLLERTPYYARATYQLQGNKISDKSFTEIINKHA
ncbi:shikimate kinase [Foetidibacter luteolus]|uniref:shikimate kinase n=1 Tax=Foetidibacter luteolus TaxID=2608880 RepID=UPI00129B1DC2|nr:shikimate kinase [Foetidibacter luteolus]